MTDAELVEFLQWALPKLDLRWEGYRKVRGQARKRIGRRIKELGVAGLGEYRAYLVENPPEWDALDCALRVTISRFYRDRGVFEFIGKTVLPALADAAAAGGEGVIRAWSAGCACGEEPYTLRLVWEFEARHLSAPARLEIVATDEDEDVLERAAAARYEKSSIKELPPEWAEKAFNTADGVYVLRGEFRQGVTFMRQDIRREEPPGTFNLVLFRNLAFTYFGESSRRKTLERVKEKLASGGALVLGRREALSGTAGFEPWSEGLRVYRRVK